MQWVSHSVLDCHTSKHSMSTCKSKASIISLWSCADFRYHKLVDMNMKQIWKLQIISLLLQHKRTIYLVGINRISAHCVLVTNIRNPKKLFRFPCISFSNGYYGVLPNRHGQHWISLIVNVLPDQIYSSLISTKILHEFNVTKKNIKIP